MKTSITHKICPNFQAGRTTFIFQDGDPAFFFNFGHSENIKIHKDDGDYEHDT
jgi:hypothetical protein